MEARLAELLKRIGQADSILRNRGRNPEPFLPIYAGGMTREVMHPAWDDSWPTPTAEDIDDFEELGLVRTEVPVNVKRKFALTVKGRKQAAILANPSPSYAGGRTPAIDEVLDWLVKLEERVPDAFKPPVGLLDQAETEGFIEPASRGALADAIVRLQGEDYLAGNLLDFEQASAEDRLGLSDELRPTMKARDRAKDHARRAEEGPGSINFYGSVVAGQIAAGNITNYTNFGDLLVAAEVELDKLEEVDEAAREDAQRLIDVLRGKATAAAGQVTTGAGGALLASVIGQLIGLPVA